MYPDKWGGKTPNHRYIIGFTTLLGIEVHLEYIEMVTGIELGKEPKRHPTVGAGDRLSRARGAVTMAEKKRGCAVSAVSG